MSLPDWEIVMDSYVGSDRRKQGQIFGTGKDAQLLRVLSAKANATRRLGSPGNRNSCVHMAQGQFHRSIKPREGKTNACRERYQMQNYKQGL